MDKIAAFIESIEKMRHRPLGIEIEEPVVELRCDVPGIDVTLSMGISEFKTLYEQNRIY